MDKNTELWKTHEQKYKPSEEAHEQSWLDSNPCGQCEDNGQKT